MLNLTSGYLIPDQEATTTCDKALIQQKNPAGLRKKVCLQGYSVPAARSDIPCPAAAGRTWHVLPQCLLRENQQNYSLLLTPEPDPIQDFHGLTLAGSSAPLARCPTMG